MNSSISSNFETNGIVTEEANRVIAPRRQSSRNILPVRTNVKAGGRDEIAARIQEWMASRASEIPTEETAV